MLPSNMLLLNLILLIDVTFSTPTPACESYQINGSLSTKIRYVLSTLCVNLAVLRGGDASQWHSAN